MADSSLTISFVTTTGSSDKFIDLELNEIANEGESSFLFGSIVHFRMFTDCTSVVFYASEGSVVDGVS